MVIKGLSNIKKRQEEHAKEVGKQWIRQLKLRDGDSANLRFLTDGDAVISAQYHTIKEMTPDGEQFRVVYCSQKPECKHCAGGVSSSEKWNFWVWVASIDHLNQNPKFGVEANANEWKKMAKKDGTGFIFRETINALMILRTSMGQRGSYRKDFEDKYEAYGTFLDRGYKYTRRGAGLKDTAYTLVPMNPSEITAEIKAAIPTLPDLAKVVSGEIKSFDNKEEAVPAAVEAEEVAEDPDDPANMF